MFKDKHYHFHFHNNNEQLLKRLLKNQKQIMASIEQLNTKVDELQAALTTEREQIQAAIDGLTTEVENLNQIITDGGTAEQRQALADRIDGIKNELAAIIPDQTGGGEENPPVEEPQA